jgi:DNA-binding phage protein
VNKSTNGKGIRVTDPYIKVVLEALDSDPRSLTRIANETGYSVSLISKLRRRGGSKFVTLRDFAQAAGMKFVIVPMGTVIEDAVYDPEETP